MKKFITIIILLSYSVASFGVSLNYFYCCGKLKTVSFKEIKKTNSCKGNKKNGCCKYQKVKHKIKVDQKKDSNNNTVLLIDNLYDDVVYNNFYSSSKAIKISVEKNFFQLPPPTLSLKRNILYCVYLI